MRTELTFKFNSDEESDFRTIVNASRYKGILKDIDDLLRNWLKYGHTFQSVNEALEYVRNELISALNEEQVSLHD